MKPFLLLLISLSTILFPLNASSQVAGSDSNSTKGGKSSRVLSTDEYTFLIEESGEATLTKALPTPGYLNFVKDVCTIPETVEVDGNTYQVTKIAEGAFKLSAIRKVIVPASIKYIDWYAFESSLLTEIELPETPLTLRTEAFRRSKIKELRIPAQTTLEYTEYFGCLPETPKLQNIFVDKSHPDLMDVDGVLCSREGCLLAYPSARKGTYVTPKEIKTTALGAFYGSHLSTIVFSEGMEEINLGNSNGGIGMCREQVRTKVLGDTLIDLNIYIGSSVNAGSICIAQPPSVYNSVTLHFFNPTPCVKVLYMGVPYEEYLYLFNTPLRILVPHGCKESYCNSDPLLLNESIQIEERAEDVTLESLKIENGPVEYGDFPNVGNTGLHTPTVEGPVILVDGIAYSINTDESNPVAKVANRGWYSFDGILNSPSLTIPDDIEHDGIAYPVTEIDDGAFLGLRYKDSSFRPDLSNYMPIKIELNNRIRRIGRYAFQSAYVSAIDLPASLEEIDYHAFCDMKMLEIVTCQATTPPLCDENAWFCETTDAGFGNVVYAKCPNDATLYVPEGCAAAYRTAVGWRDFKNIVEGTSGISNRMIDNTKSDNNIFTLQGLKLQQKPAKGIYIQNGRIRVK